MGLSSRLRPIAAAEVDRRRGRHAGAPPASAEGSEGAPGAARDAAVLAVRDRHSCAVLDGGTVTCWGANDAGQLGVDDQTDLGDGVGPDVSATSSVDLGGRAAVSVAAGAEHTCAVLDEGSVTCWGANALGQLGQDSTTIVGDAGGPTIAESPRVDLGGRRATAIATGVGHTCAVLEDGVVACWGDSTFGQLGLGSTGSVGDGTGPDVADAPDVDLGSDRSAVGVTAGNNHTCVVLGGDQILCWGFGQFGRLGQGDTQNIGDDIGPDPALVPAISLGAGVVPVAQPTLEPWFLPLDPARLVDTRPGGATIDGAFQPATRLAAGDEITLQVTGRAGVPDDATTVVLNVTANEPDAPGFVTAHPCGQPRPNASNLNYTTGETTPNNVIVGVGANGTVCLYSDQTTHLIADINGAIR